jgi:hypothetical protein
MSLTISARKQGENQSDDAASAAKPTRIKIGKSAEDSDKKVTFGVFFFIIESSEFV